LGRWSGTEVELDPKTFAAVGAEDQSARVYKQSGGAGSEVLIHSAAFLSQDDWAPHLPEVCYTANGWELVQSRTAALPGSSSARIAIHTYKQSGQRVMVAYWYQMDEGTYSEREGGRKLRREQWGRRERPPVLKTILQVGETDRAEGELLEIAAKIYEFNCTL
jgi:EpsI family protein